jgi:glucosamine--fructose-6-phosphate aminotransferase (isomerizing)
MSTWDEIHQQPEAVSIALARNRDRVEAIAAGIADAEIDYVMIAARGTSDNAARYAQYVFGARNRLPVALAAPSLFGPYRAPPALGRSLVVGISQSGASPDLVGVLEEARRQGRPTLAITNLPDSDLARAADWVIELGAGEERAVAATKTYTTELLAVAMLSSALAGGEAAPPPLEAVPEAMSAVLRSSESIAVGAALVGEAERLVVVGRGFHQATAFEWALKMQELTYVLAQPYAEPDFRHGPQAVVEEGLPILMVATTGAVWEGMVDLAREVMERGATVVAISDHSDFPASLTLEIPSAPEWVSPLPAAVAAQLFAFHLARVRNLDPDRPRGLTKVTRTR